MNDPSVYLWSRAPFMRLIIPFSSGIYLEWSFSFSFSSLIISFFTCTCLILLCFFLSLKRNYQYRLLNGILIHLSIVIAGSLLLCIKDIRNNKIWIGNNYKEHSYIVARLKEPLIEKNRTYKAIAEINKVANKDLQKNATGTIIIYFKKDSIPPDLHYGSEIIFKNVLEEIKNTGNPGSFDYKQYCLFQGITHQAYLSSIDYIIIPKQKPNALKEFIYWMQSSLVNIIRKNIKSKKERGLGEALLIGNKEDLDKMLVQSYINTGVVHIIAISGMHLALIYGLLLFLTGPLKKFRQLKWMPIVIIITGVWIFSMLTGSQPSILRSAVMLSCIAIATLISRRTSVYNSIALSAFVLLCYNPYWLWDPGFQLSYTAVLSIIIFFQPVYKLIRFHHKIIDSIWKIGAVSIAAQILTTPLSIYYFHQFPVLFLLTNMVAVPLSSLILITEILLCAAGFIPIIARYTGVAAMMLIRLMDRFIEHMERISFSVWNGLYISTVQEILLMIFLATFSYWLMKKNKSAFWLCLVSLFFFIVLRSISFINAINQKKLIVYNIPHRTAIDIIDGRKSVIIGDSILFRDEQFRKTYMQPSAIIHRISWNEYLNNHSDFFTFYQKRFAIISSNLKLIPLTPKPVIDYLILSKNPRIFISDLNSSFSIRKIIIDGSVPIWRTKIWKHDCDSLKIPFYDVKEKGAAILDLRP